MSFGMLPDHETYMHRCLELAARAKAAGLTAVGSLIVNNGEIISEGAEGEEELPDILAHAEVLAIIRARAFLQLKDLSGCTLYTTVEPCFMCSYLIRQSRMTAVVYGAPTNGTGGALSAYPLLMADDIDPWSFTPAVTGGVLREACLEMLRAGK